MRIVWNSTRDWLQLHARLGRALGGPAVRRWASSAQRLPATPPLDFSETAEAFVIRLDLPGVRKQDLEVKVADGLLEVAGEVPAWSHEDRAARPRRLERFRGPFRRVVPLPRQANTEGIRATLEQGVLTLTIAKGVPDGGRKIDIA